MWLIGLFGAALVLLAAASPAALAQSAGPGGGTGPATVRSLYPNGGGAVSLPTLSAGPISTAGSATAVSPIGGQSATAATGATPGQTGAAVGSSGTNSETASGFGGGSGGSGGGGFGRTVSRNGSGAGSGSAVSSSGRSGGNGGSLVVCPPPGTGTPAELFVGTDLACAP